MRKLLGIVFLGVAGFACGDQAAEQSKQEESFDKEAIPFLLEGKEKVLQLW